MRVANEETFLCHALNNYFSVAVRAVPLESFSLHCFALKETERGPAPALLLPAVASLEIPPSLFFVFLSFSLFR